MLKRMILPVAIAALFGVATAPTYAHHAFVMFDKQKEVTLKGTVKAFENINPHAQIVMTATQGGKTQDWTIQTESPIVLEKVGINDSTLTEGEMITARVHPMKDGKPIASLIQLTSEDGMVMSLGDKAYGELMKN
jgi:hypothetical protein